MEKAALQKCLLLLQKRWGTLFQNQVSNIIAYGSAALPQTGDKKIAASNTLDLIIEVRNSDIFHHELIKHCQDDYAGLPWIFGSSVVSFATNSVFPMHSNHIMLDDKKIKYSIIGQKHLRQDFRTWKYLSFAGRLHKAVIPLQPYSQGFEADLGKNREAALAGSLLMMKRARDMPLIDLFERIVQISYAGDIRFSAGAQNPHKVRNIVKHSFDELYAIYHPLLLQIVKDKSDVKLDRNLLSFQLTPPLLSYLIQKVPFGVYEHLQKIYGEPLVHKLLLSGVGDLSRDVSDYLKKTNQKSSFWMAFANLITGSPFNNLKYLLAKFAKGKEKQ